MQIIYNFVFWYPLLMALVLIAGGLVYHFFRERRQADIDHLPSTPLVSILVPCHNEERCVEETINSLKYIDYPALEIIAIDDGSTDQTAQVLRKIQGANQRLRVITLLTNQGKGTALTIGSLAARGQFLVCIDADVVLDPKTVRYFIWHFLNFPRCGAITGNPRVRNRTSIIGKIQVGEFSSIVGMIKRCQRVLGKIFTVSGVIAAFRKSAVVSVGFWSNDMLTEDIDISWKLQLRFWNIHYEPRALGWILMPETLQGLWRQRLRWSQGGAEVLRKYALALIDWKERRFWPVFIEYATSIVWAYMFFLTIGMFFLGLFIALPVDIRVKSIIPGWTGIILAIVCLSQVGIGLLVDNRFERGIYKMFFWLIWYPVAYWLINALVTVVGFPMAMLKKRNVLAVWESPDRGF